MSEEHSQAVAGGVVAREFLQEDCLCSVTFLTKIVPKLDIFGMKIELRVVCTEYVLFEYSVQVVYGVSHLVRIRKMSQLSSVLLAQDSPNLFYGLDQDYKRFKKRIK